MLNCSFKIDFGIPQLKTIKVVISTLDETCSEKTC